MTTNYRINNAVSLPVEYATCRRPMPHFDPDFVSRDESFGFTAVELMLDEAILEPVCVGLACL